MDPKAVRKAKSRFRIAKEQLASCERAESHERFSDAWYLFLIAAKNVYTTLEQGSKASPQSRQWFGAKKQERKDDPLLQYLFQARDDDEHGLDEVTELSPGFLGIGKAAQGFSNNITISSLSFENGKLNIGPITSNDGLPVLIEQRGPHTVLAPVTARGNIVYQPPTTHLGVQIPEPLPVPVGNLGLAYLEALIADAEARAA